MVSNKCFIYVEEDLTEQQFFKFRRQLPANSKIPQIATSLIPLDNPTDIPW